MDLEDPSQVPGILFDLLQYLIDHRGTLSPAIINSLVTESGQAWAACQSERHRSYLDHLSVTAKAESRKQQILGAQRTWILFLGAPPTKAVLRGQPFGGTLQSTRKSIFDLAAKLETILLGKLFG
jgi:hypothetical protein